MEKTLLNTLREANEVVLLLVRSNRGFQSLVEGMIEEQPSLVTLTRTVELRNVADTVGKALTIYKDVAAVLTPLLAKEEN